MIYITIAKKKICRFFKKFLRHKTSTYSCSNSSNYKNFLELSTKTIGQLNYPINVPSFMKYLDYEISVNLPIDLKSIIVDSNIMTEFQYERINLNVSKTFNNIIRTSNIYMYLSDFTNLTYSIVNPGTLENVYVIKVNFYSKNEYKIYHSTYSMYINGQLFKNETLQNLPIGYYNTLTTDISSKIPYNLTYTNPDNNVNYYLNLVLPIQTNQSIWYRYIIPFLVNSISTFLVIIFVSYINDKITTLNKTNTTTNTLNQTINNNISTETLTNTTNTVSNVKNGFKNSSSNNETSTVTTFVTPINPSDPSNPGINTTNITTSQSNTINSYLVAGLNAILSTSTITLLTENVLNQYLTDLYTYDTNLLYLTTCSIK